MSKLSEMSTFQLVVMIAFGAFAVGAIAMFALGGLGDKDAASKINVTLWGTMDRRTVEEWLRGNFDDNDNVNVVYKYINEDDFDNELIDKMSLDKGPDMVLISQDRLIRHRERLMKIPYDFYSENQFMSDYPQVAEVFLNKKEGHSYGFPVLIDPIVMYWNRSFVRNAGYTRPPDRWGNLKDFIQDSIKKAGNKIERSPIALGGYGNIEHSKAILSTLVFQSGGGIVEGEVTGLRAVFNEDFNRSIEPAVSSLMFYTDFADTRRPIYSWNSDMPNSFRAFTDEELVVYLGKTSDYKRINDTNPFFDFGVGSVPENEDGSTASYADVIGLSIIKTSSDPRGCANVAKMLTQPDSLKELSGALKGVPPAKESVLNNPPQSPFYMPVFYKAAVRSLSWTDPDPANTDEIFSDMVNSVVNEGAELDDAVDRAQNRFKGMISNL